MIPVCMEFMHVLLQRPVRSLAFAPFCVVRAQVRSTVSFCPSGGLVGRPVGPNENIL
jgi:hypothetical protein